MKRNERKQPNQTPNPPLPFPLPTPRREMGEGGEGRARARKKSPSDRTSLLRVVCSVLSSKVQKQLDGYDRIYDSVIRGTKKNLEICM